MKYEWEGWTDSTEIEKSTKWHEQTHFPGEYRWGSWITMYKSKDNWTNIMACCKKLPLRKCKITIEVEGVYE